MSIAQAVTVAAFMSLWMALFETIIKPIIVKGPVSFGEIAVIQFIGLLLAYIFARIMIHFIRGMGDRSGAE